MIDKVEVDALDPGEIVDGLREQVKPPGAEQVSEICPLKPPTAPAVIVSFDVPPRVTVSLGAERVSEKSAPVAAAAGVMAANTAVVLPPFAKLGWLLPPAVI